MDVLQTLPDTYVVFTYKMLKVDISFTYFIRKLLADRSSISMGNKRLVNQEFLLSLLKFESLPYMVFRMPVFRALPKGRTTYSKDIREKFNPIS